MQCVCVRLSSFVTINFRIFCARCRCQRQGCLKHLSYIFIVCCFAIVIYSVFLVILLLLLWLDGVRRKWVWESERNNDCVPDRTHADWNVFSWLVRVFMRPKSTQWIGICCILMMADTIWPWLCSTFVRRAMCAHDVIACHRFYTPTLFICVNRIGIVVRCCCGRRRCTSYLHISIIYSSSSSSYLLVSELYMPLLQAEWRWVCFSAHCVGTFQFTIECFIIFQ